MAGAEAQPEVRTSFCRFCGAACGILVTVRGGRAEKIVGDVDHPVSRGFTCEKGRALPDQHNDPHRLLSTVQRMPGGAYQPIPSARALDEVAARLQAIVAKYGPRSVALYAGNGATNPLARVSAKHFLSLLGWSMYYKSATIDRPGKIVAGSTHGHWGGGAQDFDSADVWLFAGTNPVVSMWGGLMMISPTRRLRDARRRGRRLIVIDPRRTELAAFADLHLRPRPGQDPALLAAILRTLLEEDLVDHAFVNEHVAGVAVDRFTPSAVEGWAGVPAADIRTAARMFGEGTRGGRPPVSASTCHRRAACPSTCCCASPASRASGGGPAIPCPIPVRSSR